MPRIRVPNMYSPYGPRPRRSARLVLLWMAILAVALVATFYLTTRERGATASYAGPRVPGGDDEKGAKEEEEAGRGIARMMSKMVP
ncbi:hypothetical protein Hte_004012 [Hypoxylon texense]